jgi:hypothetical protein
VLIPRALLVQRAVVMSRGGVFSSVIQARLQRSHVFDASTPRDRELIVGLYGCLFALDGVLKSGAGNVSLVSLDDVFLRILMLLLFPELQVIDESPSIYKLKLVPPLPAKLAPARWSLSLTLALLAVSRAGRRVEELRLMVVPLFRRGAVLASA